MRIHGSLELSSKVVGSTLLLPAISWLYIGLRVLPFMVFILNTSMKSFFYSLRVRAGVTEENIYCGKMLGLASIYEAFTQVHRKGRYPTS